MDPTPTDTRGNARSRRVAKPLDAARLDELALAYVARFATSAGKLAAYLRRKVRERGWNGDGEVNIPAIVERFVSRGYVDDAGFARARAQGLLRRGFGARRIDQALNAAGIARDLREAVSGSERDARAAALAFARKRRLGPFGRCSADQDQVRLDPVTCGKQVAAFLRAGHPLASARALVNADSITQAEEWADEELD